MLKYEELIERQHGCMPCNAEPPGPDIGYECPFCLRKVTKEVYDDFHARNKKVDIMERYNQHWKRFEGGTRGET